MNDSQPPTMGRRGLLRAGVGATAAAALSQQATAQEGENETAEGENETAGGEGENETAEGEGDEGQGEGDGEGEEGGVDPDPADPSQVPYEYIGGLLLVGLLSPALFAVLMKFVYDDDRPRSGPERGRR